MPCHPIKALADAAKPLDLNNTTGASDTLLTALNTLVVVEQAIPLLIIIPRAGVADAEQEDKTDKATAQTLREVARKRLNRSMELGYDAVDPEYAELNSEIFQPWEACQSWF